MLAMYLTNIYSAPNIITGIGVELILVNKIIIVSGLMEFISYNLVVKTENQHTCKQKYI